MVASINTKLDPNSSLRGKLTETASEVSWASKGLSKAAKQAIELIAQQEVELNNKKLSAFTLQLEQQEKVNRLQRDLDKAYLKLKRLRRQEYSQQNTEKVSTGPIVTGTQNIARRTTIKKKDKPSGINSPQIERNVPSQTENKTFPLKSNPKSKMINKSNPKLVKNPVKIPLKKNPVKFTPIKKDVGNDQN